ncbi:hypothetical protein [Aliiroseovarius crassostreae]|uniref:hypothetical protein n=1 Tax=Aliiroseovarius crassostreae TaxID=154981 RepID=UPI003C7AA8B7
MTHMSREEVSHIVADLEHRFIAHDTYLELRDQVDDILYRRKAHTAAGRVNAPWQVFWCGGYYRI